MLEVSVDLGTVTVMEGLTEDAVYARLHEGEPGKWLFVREAMGAWVVGVGGCLRKHEVSGGAGCGFASGGESRVKGVGWETPTADASGESQWV